MRITSLLLGATLVGAALACCSDEDAPRAVAIIQAGAGCGEE